MGTSNRTLDFPVPVDLHSVVDSHEQPFVVIDAAYRIVAVNRAYEQAFRVSAEQAIGQTCYHTSHHSAVPCHQNGEDCPYLQLFENGERYSCLHAHYGSDDRRCLVRVKAYPLRDLNGQLLMGELIQRLPGDGGQCANVIPMAGGSAPFLACLEQLQMVAELQAPVLLQGETGVGKELAAHYIHARSARKHNEFLTLDCTVVPESLFEAEVFGHAAGAFTGSVGERVGLLEQADGGTLFLDEMGEMPLSQQAKLLRVLESGQYRRVGGRRYRKADVRVICATNRNLSERVSAGGFREDLYYRVSCLTVRLPPLRERLDDLPVLAGTLLEPISRTLGRELSLTPEAVARLKTYPFPGNVRELRNLLFSAAARCTAGVLDVASIDRVLAERGSMRQGGDSVADAVGETAQTPAQHGDASGQSLDDAEARHIAELLRRHRSREAAAVALGISVRTLYRKIKRYRLN